MPGSSFLQPSKDPTQTLTSLCKPESQHIRLFGDKRYWGPGDARRGLNLVTAPKLLSCMKHPHLHQSKLHWGDSHQTFNLDTPPCPLTWITSPTLPLGTHHPTLHPTLGGQIITRPVCPAIPPSTWATSPRS